MANPLDTQAGRIYPQFGDTPDRATPLPSRSTAAAASTGSELFWMHFGGGIGFTLALVDTLHNFGTTTTTVSGSQRFWSAFAGDIGQTPQMVHELTNFGTTAGGGGGSGSFWIFGDSVIAG